MGVLDDFRLTGEVSIVTGASRGLGRAMAEALAEAGSDVVLAARDEETLETVARGIRSLRVKALVVPTNVENEQELDRLVERTVEQFGRIDILVNDAGATVRCPAMDFSIEDWDKVIAVNLRSVFLLSQKVARVMARQGGGRIINVASMTSEVGVPTIPAYAASKGGIRQLTKALAVEWAEHNIRVNAIGPGFFHTDMTEPLYRDPERHGKVINRVAIKRWGKPEDLKGAVVYLASKASEYVTGQILYVDGGYLAG
jgi:NAD(P)-dependent dehydrogenase (short-subunit alcohol dehydrogenase family)